MEFLGRFNDDLTRVFDEALGTQWAEIEEMTAISAVASLPAVTTRELAELARVNRRAVSRMVARMSADGLVSCRPSDLDRRAVALSLTDLGARRARVLEVSIIEFFRDNKAIALEISAGLGSNRFAPATSASAEPMELLRRVCEAGVSLVRFMPDAASQGRLAARQRAALVQVVTGGRVRPGDLTSSLGVSRGGVAYIVDQLCAKGYVVRRRGALAEDRRAVILEATDAGAAAVHAVMSGIHEQREMLADLFFEIAQWRPDTVGAERASEAFSESAARHS
ncbi:MarR family winged helix-turn-helix transcriptional regulator [Microbacterium sp. SLBN-146]|uniref:MarR family winged helix-turn-helix transcriptional regulator n=1 Tax=Microbacterium sp. SLBN-146 TaxID=2768457 RepID=UPI0016426B55|nr:MarR family transcriptional regulator [Microbacterium sp. SLBN-146]